MSMPLNKTYHTKLIEEDIAWLLANTEKCLEQDSIISNLRFMEQQYKGGGDYAAYVFDRTDPANQP